MGEGQETTDRSLGIASHIDAGLISFLCTGWLIFWFWTTAQAQTVYTPYSIITFAGSASSGSADGPGDAAQFNSPKAIAVDSTGVIYVADTANHVIRRITPAGMVSTWAGTAGVAGSADGTGARSLFNSPSGLLLDPSGNLYVADTGNHTLRSIRPDAAVITIAGLAGSPGSVDAVGTAARFNSPAGLAMDVFGNLFVADGGNNTIREIAPDGTVSTYAGAAGPANFVNGPAAAARFSHPTGVGIGPHGQVYVADQLNNSIRIIETNGAVSTFSGGGLQGNIDGPNPRFGRPTGLVTDAAGNIYIADMANSTIRLVAPDGTVSTLAGTAGIKGAADGFGLAAHFNLPQGIAVDASGSLYVADTANNTVRRIDPDKTVQTIAGAPPNGGAADGPARIARFALPGAVALDAAGSAVVADTANHTIRGIATDGTVSTLAGQAGRAGFADGPAAASLFHSPSGVTIADGTVFVADSGNQVIRWISTNGIVATVAGLAGNKGFADGFGSAARFNRPAAIGADRSGTIYVADAGNQVIRKIGPDGSVSTLAGSAGNPGFIDGFGLQAQFRGPSGLAVDDFGNIYVADTGNHTIRKIDPSGSVTTLAGFAAFAGTTDGTGSSAQFNSPSGVAVDAAGILTIADTGNHTLRSIAPGGVVTTLAGTPGVKGDADGTGPFAFFNSPAGIAVDRQGALYVADSGNNTVRKGAPNFGPVIASGPASQTITAPEPAVFNIVSTGIAPLRYQWQRDGAVIPGATNAQFTIARAETNDIGNYSVIVSNAYGSATSSPPALLTVLALPPNIVSQPSNLIIPAGATTNLAVVVSGSAPLSYQWEFDSADIPGAVTASLQLLNATTNQSGVYSVRARNPYGVAATRDWTVTVSPIIITIAPKSQTVPLGIPAAWSVAAAGVGKLTYQWQFDGTNIPAATNRAYRTAPARLTDAGEYTVVITGAYGSVTSVPAVLTVVAQPPVIVTAPVGAAAPLASNVTLRVVASGSPPFGFQWQLNGAVLPGVSADTFVITNLGLSNAGIYSVVVTNLYGSATSSPPAVVTALPPAPSYSSAAVGRGGSGTSQDGPASSARFNGPTGLAADGAGNVYVADTLNHTIRRIAPDHSVITWAGAPNNLGSADGPGATARFNLPSGVAADPAGNVYIADTGNGTIRKIMPDGAVATIAGLAGSYGSADGPGSQARFYLPSGLAVDVQTNLYIADTGNNTIRRITPGGTVETFAGAAGNGGSADGSRSNARFRSPFGVAVDASGVVYIADTYNDTLRKIALDGTVTTLAGLAGTAGSVDGQGPAASFSRPKSLAVDASGLIYVADWWNNLIRVVTSNGLVLTPALVNGASVSAAISVVRPAGIAVDGGGILYIADTGNNVIRIAAAIQAPVVSQQFVYSNGILFVAWPASTANYVLETTRTLSSPTIWKSITNGIGRAGSEYFFRVDLSGDRGFFRLRYP